MEPSVSPLASGLELFTTSSGHNTKTKKDCYRLRSLLDVKKIHYVEVDLALQLWRRREMLKRSGGIDTLPQLHAYGKFLGDLAVIQDLEDHDELEAALQPPITFRADSPDAAECTSSSESSGTKQADSVKAESITPAADHSPVNGTAAVTVSFTTEEPATDASLGLEQNSRSLASPSEQTDESSLLGTLKDSSLAQSTDRSWPESPSETLPHEQSQQTPARSLSNKKSQSWEDGNGVNQLSPVSSCSEPQSRDVPLNSPADSHSACSPSSEPPEQLARSNSTPSTAHEKPSPFSSLPVPPWQANSDSRKGSPRGLAAVGMVNATTASKEELAQAGVGSPVSNSDSTLAGTLTEPSDSGSLIASDRVDSPQSVPSPIAVGAFAPEGELHPDETPLSRGDENESVSFARSHTPTASIPDSPAPNSPHLEGRDHAMKESSRRDSEALTSITAAVEASQRRAATANGEHDMDGDSDTPVAIHQVQRASSSSLAGSSDEEDEPAARKQPSPVKLVKSISTGKTVREALSEAKNSSIFDTRNGPVMGRDKPEEESLSPMQLERLAELDSLLSTSSQLPGSIPHTGLSEQAETDSPEDWEFVQDTLSSRMQAIRQWSGKQGTKRTYAITSESSGSISDLVPDIRSHPLKNWPAEGIIEPFQPSEPQEDSVSLSMDSSHANNDDHEPNDSLEETDHLQSEEHQREV